MSSRSGTRKPRRAPFRWLMPILFCLSQPALSGGSFLPDTGFLEVAPEYRNLPVLHYEISLAERKLFEYIDGELKDTYPIAVGRPGLGTPTGNFRIYKVDWNPDWTPPASSWAAKWDYTPPGHPDNPMGRVRLRYFPPYSLHGTDNTWSLGKAVSHGSVRVANEDIIGIARRIMRHGGIKRSEAWFSETLSTPTEMRRIVLPRGVALLVRPE
ncbi:L,D-transpeptidase [Marinobacter sp.]|uniref:L,D-transpeptidase n=1 Tax=Marinobacter sp. TaxID=50741 RepID=UPI00384D8C5C